MPNTRYVNPKHLAQMELTLRKVYNSTFDEGDIKMLLLGLRDHLQKAEKESHKRGAPREIQIGLPYLVDLADSIAHPEMKNQGRIRSHIKSTDSQIAKALARMPTQKIHSINQAKKIIDIEIPPAIKTVSAFDIAITFITFLSHCFSADFQKIHDRGADIEVCLLSMLHFMQFPQLDDAVQKTDSHSRQAYLALHTFNGFHHINAVVLNSDYKNLLDQSTLQSSHHPSPTNVFQVFSSSVPAEIGMNFNALTPEIVFATRDPSGKIALKKYHPS